MKLDPLTWRNRTFWPATMLWLALVCAALIHAFTAEVTAAVPRDPIQAHRYADRVLAPRFTADYNAWTYEHPTDPEGREGEHCKRLDAGDVARWKAARESFRELDEAMKRAGY